MLPPKSTVRRFDLEEECNICVWNSRSDQDPPCNICIYNVIADQYDEQYGNYQEIIEKYGTEN